MISCKNSYSSGPSHSETWGGLCAQVVRSSPESRWRCAKYICTCVCWMFISSGTISAQDVSTAVETPVIHVADDRAQVEALFEQNVLPFLKTYCFECHNVDNREAGIRLDHLDSHYEDATIKLWEAVAHLVDVGEMPPQEAVQPESKDREGFLTALSSGVNWARLREVPRHGNIRRLTVSQYANTLRDLLGIEENLTSILPPDGVSKDGFSNNSQTLQLSPLQMEAYLQIAEQALDSVLIEEAKMPPVQAFQMELGAGINAQPYPGELVLGAQNLLLANQDFVVTEKAPNKSFAFQPFTMQKKFRFIEGYQGNDTVRGWRDFDSIYHAVFACMRGSEGYPKGRAFETVATGLLLRPAIPSSEIFGESSTYGPHANFKIALRELPDTGRFRIRVWGAKYEDGLLLEPTDAALEAAWVQHEVVLTTADLGKSVEIRDEGVYQVDLFPGSEQKGDEKDGKTASPDVTLRIGSRQFSRQWSQAPFVVVRLKPGKYDLGLSGRNGEFPQRLAIGKLPDSSETCQRFLQFEKRKPTLGVYVGLRRDCGSTLSPVGQQHVVDGYEIQEFVFEGSINNFPRPEVEQNNVNYLAGIREIGVRCEYTDGRDIPRLLVRKVEFEGPFYDQWPPASYSTLMLQDREFASEQEKAEAIIVDFATRAFRRPVTDLEKKMLMKLWLDAGDQPSFVARVRNVLLVILTSPQFLFLSETSQGPQGEPLDDWELASKLSYFLWDAPPDRELLEMAARGQVRVQLSEIVRRMIANERYRWGSAAFVSQWLSLDKLDVVSSDQKRFPKLTRLVKEELRKEPIEYWLRNVRDNRPLEILLESDEVVVNDVLAAYYGLMQYPETGFRFDSVKHQRAVLGGLLSQAGIMAGLSDGREPNPVKRGAWLARKIIAEPPGDPPPNVPALEDLTQLTLRQRLEKHRDVAGCAKCHQGIDPWGLPFEEFDAGGLHRDDVVDSSTTLANGRKLTGFREFRDYLLNEKKDQVAFSVAKHLSIYANGKSLSYRDEIELREKLARLKPSGYRLLDVVDCVVSSDSFLLK
jgi:hypothetical protein